MTYARKQAQFERARWRRRLLLPAWAAQAVLMLAVVGVFAYRLAETAVHFDADHAAGRTPTVELVWECTNIAFALVGLVLVVAEGARLYAATLTPFFLLAAHVVAAACAAAILALDVVVYTMRAEGNWSTVALALDVALLAVALALCVYAIVAYRRLLPRNGEDDDAYDLHHHRPGRGRADKAFGFTRTGGYEEIELSRGPAGGGGGGGGSAGLASGDVFLRPYQDAPAADTGPAGSAGSAAAGGGRRASYSHERDPQFDAYVPARGILSKDDIDQALHAELWGAGTGTGGPGVGPGAGPGAGPDAAGSPAAVARSPSVVAAGVVASHHTVPAPVSAPRDPVHRVVSWSVEHHGVAPPAALPPVHETVPEDHDDRAALLGQARQVSDVSDDDDDDHRSGNNPGRVPHA